MKIEELLAYETGLHLGDGSLQKWNRVHRIIYCGDINNDYDFYAKIVQKFLMNFTTKKQ